MRVVHLINGLPRIGGAERLLLDLATHSSQRPVTVITWWTRDHSLAEAEGAGILEVIALRPFSIGALRRAIAALSRADVVHLHLFPTQYLGPFMWRPTVFTEHNTWNRRRDRPYWRPLERWCYSHFDKVVAISPGTATSLEAWLRRRPPRIEVIPNGIRLDRFGLAPRAASQGGTVHLGMAARFAPEKDQATLIGAMRHLPPSYRLRLAGDGPLLQDAIALAKRCGVGDRVEFLGVAHDMHAYLRSIDLYVQSSNADGFSIVTVEAMASGLPVIAADIDGLRDTVGDRALIFAHKDPQALARLAREVCEDAARYARAAQHSVTRARAFDVRETVRRYDAAYAEVAARPAPVSSSDHR